ncbi:amidohydrolase family protein [uncultured Cohaesibacter sp.]|uniref:amidohydrolase family protein n=1 Tax=uncultured Cohaesibacter sp. TaxID=1002546 RepID=UPI0029306CD6|nr:amidohydrolase family protein [uncultured Cohaesibacter sp.]
MDRRRFLQLAATNMMAAPLLPGALSALSDSAHAEGVQDKDDMLMIDSHVHVWKIDPKFPFSPERKPPTEDATVEMVMDMMKANGISRTVLIQMIYYKWDNSYIADVLKRYPGQFHGVARVNPEDPAAPDHLERLVKEDGFSGVRISPYTAEKYDWIKGPLMPPLWKKCADLNSVMTVLTEAPRLPQLIPLIEANPDLTVVIDHMADVALDDEQGLKDLLALARYPKVYLKISHLWKISKQPYPYNDSMDRLKVVYDAFGPKKLMWGTDWPVSGKWLTYPQAVQLYREHLSFMPKEDQAQILGKTVQEVWPFGL